MTRASAASSSPLLSGRYRVFEQLGEGRLATVFAAFDERLQRRVLVHLLRKDLVERAALRQRFLDEASSSSQRSHPALLELFDSGEIGRRPFLITEYAEGPTLRSLGMLAPEQALLYGRQIIAAVHVCQSRNLPHPPISSSNMLLVQAGQVKLLENWRMPPADIAFDLAHYRAPERVRGAAPTSSATVYALGILLYELLSGRRPISGTDARAVLQAHLTTRLPALAQLKPALLVPALDEVLARATEPDPLQRFANAAEFGAALDAIWRQQSSETQPLPARPVRPARQRTAAATPLAPATTPALPPPGPRPIRSAERRQRAFQHGLRGWIAVLVLALVIGLGGYALVGLAIDQLFAIQLPRIELPGWPGGADAAVLVVNTAALNLRAAPNLESEVLTILPGGSRVQQIGGPREQDRITWIEVRVERSGEQFEGWVSLAYLKAEE
jgi:eukaryotic-like serine/threonine-protein kinase